MKKHFWWMSVALWLPLQAAAQDERFHSPVDIPFLMSGSLANRVRTISIAAST